MSGESPIYRSEAVDSLTAPSRLNVVAPLTSPRLWVAILSAAFLVLAALGWAVLGQVALPIHGTGVLVRGTHVTVAEATTAAQVSEVMCRPGSKVEAGQELFRMRLPVQAAASQAATRRVEQLKRQDELLRGREDEVLAKVQAAMDEQSSALSRQLQTLTSLLAQHKKQVDLCEKLRGDGVVGDRDYLDAVSDALQVERILSQTQSDLQQLARDRSMHQIGIESSRADRLESLLSAEAAAAEALALFDRDRTVLAPESGTVVQVLAYPGLSVEPNEPLAIISPAGDGPLNCLAFFPLASGKRLADGMPAQVAPTVAARERFGWIQGKVNGADLFATSQSSVVDRIHTRDLASQLGQRYGPTLGALITLDTDAAGAGGFSWSGGHGYDAALTEGTMVEVDVVVEKVRPIALLLPWLREVVGQ